MQDSVLFLIQFSYAEFENTGHLDKFYGIFDGHSSSYVSNFLSKRLPELIFSHPKYNLNIIEAIEEVFESLNKTILDQLRNQSKDTGSTAIVAIVQKNHFFIINLGDSLASLVSNSLKYFKFQLFFTEFNGRFIYLNSKILLFIKFHF